MVRVLISISFGELEVVSVILIVLSVSRTWFLVAGVPSEGNVGGVDSEERDFGEETGGAEGEGLEVGEFLAFTLSSVCTR